MISLVYQEKKKEYSLEESLISSAVKHFDIKAISSYEEFLTITGSNDTSDDVSLLKKAVKNDWLNVGFDSLYKFENKPLTRIDFIIAISKLLVESGAQYRPISVDFTPYKDWFLVPEDKKRYLTTYVLELGYGGDSSSKLNPNNLITNAQAAVVLDRFFQWKKSKLKLKNQYFNTKSVALKQ
tara:strand:- start:3246 stop:3791 length:546 start_codon:yes stop_codon:yes gene_type:complete